MHLRICASAPGRLQAARCCRRQMHNCWACGLHQCVLGIQSVSRLHILQRLGLINHMGHSFSMPGSFSTNRPPSSKVSFRYTPGIITRACAGRTLCSIYVNVHIHKEFAWQSVRGRPRRWQHQLIKRRRHCIGERPLKCTLLSHMRAPESLCLS